MDLTQGTTQEKQKRAKKMMLWFGIISLVMSFAGLTSAFIVSSSREDWLANFTLPSAFTYSTLIIILSNVTCWPSKIISGCYYLIKPLYLGVNKCNSEDKGSDQK